MQCKLALPLFGVGALGKWKNEIGFLFLSSKSIKNKTKKKKGGQQRYIQIISKAPTETLLRLLLPLNGKVQPTSSDPATRLPGSRAGRAPRASPDRSSGRSDGRGVQRLTPHRRFLLRRCPFRSRARDH